MSATRRQRIRRAIGRLGLRRLTSDTRRLADELPDQRAVPLRASIAEAADDAGVAVWEWYEAHAPERLEDLVGDHWL